MVCLKRLLLICWVIFCIGQCCCVVMWMQNLCFLVCLLWLRICKCVDYGNFFNSVESFVCLGQVLQNCCMCQRFCVENLCSLGLCLVICVVSCMIVFLVQLLVLILLCIYLLMCQYKLIILVFMVCSVYCCVVWMRLIILLKGNVVVMVLC